MKEETHLSRTIVALDNISIHMAEEVIGYWSSKVHGFKVNHILYPHITPRPFNILCDYKLFDIPNTMSTIIEKLIDDGTDMVTVHTRNSPRHLDAISKYADKIKILGVTYLTSWDELDVQQIYGRDPETLWKFAIDQMKQSGFYGAICSPLDLPHLKDSGLKTFCPGIRYSETDDDQIRVATPEYAIDNGADYLIMGRSFFDNHYVYRS